MARYDLEGLARTPTRQISALFDAGAQPDVDALVDWEFRGFNKPLITKLGGFQKFKKGFYRKGEEVWGYNVPVRQGALERPWTCLPADDQPRRFGFYRVHVLPEFAHAAREPRSLLLDYSEGGNPLYEGSFLRDYLRQVDPDDPDVYIGKAYTALGARQLFPTFFVLQRDREAPVAYG